MADELWATQAAEVWIDGGVSAPIAPLVRFDRKAGDSEPPNPVEVVSVTQCAELNPVVSRCQMQPSERITTSSSPNTVHCDAAVQLIQPRQLRRRKLAESVVKDSRSVVWKIVSLSRLLSSHPPLIDLFTLALRKGV